MSLNSPKGNGLTAILDRIERIGNRLPDPVTLFALLTLLVILASAIAAGFNLSAINPATEETVEAVSLLTGEGIRRIISEAVPNFIEFPPLGTVLVAILGVGIAQHSGLLGTALRRLVLIAPAKFASPMVVFAGVMSNLAADAGYVILVPLAAVIFRVFQRHPIAGLVAGFAGVSGGFSANLIINPLDPLLAGLSQSGASLINNDYSVNAMANYYFMAISTFLITFVGWYVTDYIVEPRLGNYDSEETTTEPESLTPSQRKGLRWAGYTLLAYIICLGLLTLPPEAILRDPETDSLITEASSPFIDGIVFLVALGFFFPGLVYGKVAGTIKNDKDAANAMSQAMSSMGYYLVLAFVAAQFIAYFDWSNLGIIFAISGAQFLQATGIEGLPALFLFVAFSIILNLFIGSASAKWAILAPIFVPMLMIIGYSPEATQALYRIGDSSTNIITPLMPYFPVVIAFGQQYDQQLGIGRLIVLMFPYCILFLISWLVLFFLWAMLELPLGPNAPIQLS
ncbi:AbgT family transporter [Euhalothece natronophila Z-M001]|uniref:AbgT family transporter n=1 Tax=Euhalothece natronophila Z-M001 TaxID=522448 RepID=A0A5B8NI11_9CHRO|nr:AbgT family transporter [Euhalothece natronophila]QDZ38527.1 AbgT family transporter [Euhalothece natronophila Z-M001]